MLTSHSNQALYDCRAFAEHFETGSVGAARGAMEYLEGSFGTDAANDDLYTPEEIDHAHRVLTKFLAVYA